MTQYIECLCSLTKQRPDVITFIAQQLCSSMQNETGGYELMVGILKSDIDVGQALCKQYLPCKEWSACIPLMQVYHEFSRTMVILF